MTDIVGNASLQDLLDATTLRDVTPMLSSGGHISVTTDSSGTSFTSLSSQACKQVTIANNSGTTIEVQQGGTGVGFPIFPSTYFTFFGLTDASNLGIRRVDQSTTAVSVIARWES